LSFGLVKAKYKPVNIEPLVNTLEARHLRSKAMWGG
jgi:hypothetical protein